MRAATAGQRAALGQNLAKARHAKGISQKEAAWAIRTSPRSVTNWESGTKMPHTTEVWRLCKLYGVTFEVLMVGVFEEKKA